MSALLLLVALAISIAGVGYLCVTNVRRRRILGQDTSQDRRHVFAARALVWAPGLMLIVLGQTAGVVMWFAALTTIGWAIVAAPITTADIAARASERAVTEFRRLQDVVIDRIQVPRLPTFNLKLGTAKRDLSEERFIEQEQRIAALEARLAILEQRSDAVERDVLARPEMIVIEDQPRKEIA